MWHGVRNGIIMRNTIYAGNKLTEERVMFSRQFYKSSSFFDPVDSCQILTTIRGLDRLIVDLKEVRVKKSMKTVYSYRIQGTMSKSVFFSGCIIYCYSVLFFDFLKYVK